MMPMQRFEAHSTDPDEANRTLITLFDSPVETTADPGRTFEVEAVASLSPAFSWLDLGLMYQGRAATEALTNVLIGAAWSGELRWEAQGERRDRSSPLVVLPGRVAHAEFDGMRMYSATIAAGRIEDQLAAWDLGPPRAIDALGHPDGPAAVALTALLRHLGTEHRRNPAMFDDLLVRTTAEQAVIAALVAAGPAFAEHDAADRGEPRALRRAIAYIEEHADAAITVPDIAAAARMSVRGVQDLFRRELGTSPTLHLRGVRLDRARQELLAADPSTAATVEAVARRWGFGHLGRFAGAYRSAFDEYPRETLAR